jgi:hypothetical protein
MEAEACFDGNGKRVFSLIRSLHRNCGLPTAKVLPQKKRPANP